MIMHCLAKSFSKMTSTAALLLFLLSNALSANDAPPLEVYTKVHDLEMVREAVRGGFEDIVGSPTLVSEGAYMQILLEANGFITLQEHLCDIIFQETVDGLKIIAIPYDQVGGQKVEVMDFTTRKGVYMMIEGAAEELNYEAESRMPIPEGLGGFLNFTFEIKRLSQILEGGQAPVIHFANYPQQGRIFQLVSPSGVGMVMVEENPIATNHVLRLWVVEDLNGGSSPDSRLIQKWLDEIRDEVLDGGPKIYKMFHDQDSDSYTHNGFDVVLSTQPNGGGVKKSLLVQDNPSVSASKQAY